MKRTVLLLGGMPNLLPVIEAAHELGCSVVTCDYLPANYAHRFADGYVNASIVDREAVLDAAVKVRADAIMSFSADSGVVSAAYAAWRLGLPAPAPVESVETLQDKCRFRSFLSSHGFHCPHNVLVTKGADDEALAAFVQVVPAPYMVKPTDLSGSKGVSVAHTFAEVKGAVGRALDASRASRCIVEEFVSFDTMLETDAIVIGGVVHVPRVHIQSYDACAPNPFVPAATTTSSALTSTFRKQLEGELQRLCDLLHIESGLLNVEACLCDGNRLMLMEVSPRGGGGYVSLVERLSCGPDLIRDAVRLALGDPIDPGTYLQDDSPDQANEVWRHENVHSIRDGLLGRVWLDDGLRRDSLVRERVWVAPGEKVRALASASDIFGSIILRFPDMTAFKAYADEPRRYLRVEVS